MVRIGLTGGIATGKTTIARHLSSLGIRVIDADEIAREQKAVKAIDTLNRRFGERTVHSAHTLGTGIYVRTKVPFGSTRYL